MPGRGSHISQQQPTLYSLRYRYTPQAIDLDTKMKPFMPDYILCVGDIDAFLKVGCIGDPRGVHGTCRGQCCALPRIMCLTMLCLQFLCKKNVFREMLMANLCCTLFGSSKHTTSLCVVTTSCLILPLFANENSTSICEKIYTVIY